MNTAFYYLFSRFWYHYLLTCEVCNLGNFTASIVIRVESFESVYEDHWLRL